MTRVEKRLRQGGQDPAIPMPVSERLRRALSGVAGSDCPVLLVGETGVGKRRAAREIHARSKRSRLSFRELSCQDLDSAAARAALETAGTLYLTDTESLSIEMQEFLLDTYFRSGRTPTARLIFGSRHELLEDVRILHIEEEFYYHISAVTLRISPLRYRKSEILGITDALLSHYAAHFERPKPVLGGEIVDFLTEHNWPGNLRELDTAVKTIVAIDDQAVSLAALKAATPGAGVGGPLRNSSLKRATREVSYEVERRLISQVLSATGWNRKRAAAELGISYKALLYKIKQFGLEDRTQQHRWRVAV